MFGIHSRRAAPTIKRVPNAELSPGSSLDRLSPRELQVLELTALGLTNTELGERLDISVHGVKYHLATIYRKLGVANRTEAVAVHFRGRVGSVGKT
jgi:ATP/maltotriose-dependent transcriptional regulator MalT